MKQRSRLNLIISAVAMMGALMVIFYLVMTMPTRLDLIITFGIIVLIDTYFLADGILKRIDDISNDSLNKQAEIVKVDKGIYSVAKREEAAMSDRFNQLVSMIENLVAENERLNQELMEQQKLFAKVDMKKNQENINKVVGGNDRLAKLLVQLTSNNTTAYAEVIELLDNIAKALEPEKKKEQTYAKVQKMPPRAE